MSFAIRLALSLFVLSQLGCGPITASTKIDEAKSQVIKAASMGAPKYAPFEYQGALLYLEKAREEEGYAYYQDAVKLAKEAFQLALDAQRVTQERIREERIEKESKNADVKPERGGAR